MARIQAEQLSENSYQFKIVDLSTTWSGSNRDCFWYWNRDTGGYPLGNPDDPDHCFQTEIKGYPTEHGGMKLSNMGYNMTYWVEVYIYGIPPYGEYQSLAYLRITVRTDEDGNAWSFVCNGYDYNEELFVFGRIESVQPVSYVVLTTNTGYKYKSFLKDVTDNPGLFNIRTSRDAIGNAPKFLSSDTYTFQLSVYGSSGKLIGTSDIKNFGGKGLDLWKYKMHNSLYPPTLSYDNKTKTITVTNQGTGRYFLEIRRSDRNKVNNEYTTIEKDYFYTTLMCDTEGGKWREGTYKLLNYTGSDYDPRVCQPVTNEINTIILFDEQANFSSTMKKKYSGLVNNILDYVAQKTGLFFESRVEVTRSADADVGACWTKDRREYNEYQLIIRLGTEGSSCTISGSIGLWTCFTSGYNIATSCANISVDLSEEEGRLEPTILEEICQSLGMGNDSYFEETSIHWEPWYGDQASLSDLDEKILSLYFQKDIRGWSRFDLINEYDTPCLLFQDYTGEDLVFDVSDLIKGEDFYAQAWTVKLAETSNEDCPDTDLYSPRASIAFNTSSEYSYPGQFSWTYPKRKGEPFNLTADEWTGFQEHVNKMLLYKKGEGFVYSKVQPGQAFKADHYNEVVEAIREMSNYTEAPTVQPGETITADVSSPWSWNNRINVIVDDVNNISENGDDDYDYDYDW